MVERFLEQYPALQAAVLDPRIRKPIERDRLDGITDEDFTKAEEFIKVMKVLYTSTLCVSSEKTASCRRILLILMKPKAHFTVQEGDSSFVSDIKRKVLTDLSGRYQEEKIQQFLGEVTAMDPRFKAKSVRYSTWEHLQEAAVAINAIEADVPIPESHEDSDTTEEAMYENPQVEVSPPSQPKAKSALEELFAEEEQERRTIRMNNSNSSIQQRVRDEIQLCRSLPMISMAEDPVLCSRWWTRETPCPC